jgi:hypothetical protein
MAELTFDATLSLREEDPEVPSPTLGACLLSIGCAVCPSAHSRGRPQNRAETNHMKLACHSPCRLVFYPLLPADSNHHVS